MHPDALASGSSASLRAVPPPVPGPVIDARQLKQSYSTGSNPSSTAVIPSHPHHVHNGSRHKGRDGACGESETDVCTRSLPERGLVYALAVQDKARCSGDYI